jgi:polar amino acid transport system substrate-binding protein
VRGFRVRFLLAAALLVGLAAAPFLAKPATAQSSPEKTLRVATKPIAPFVIVGADGRRSGFSIDLWSEIGRRLGVKTTWVDRTKVGEVLTSVEDGSADVGIAAISMTVEREQAIDFTHPYYDAGISVLVRATSTQGPFSVLGDTLLNWRLLQPFLVLLIAAVVIAHIMWLVERRGNPDFPDRYRTGIWEAIWWSLVNVFTGGDAEKTVRRPTARVIAILWMAIGIFLIAFLTASVTSTLTVNKLQSDIKGISDLAGRRVVSVAGTTPSAFLDRTGIAHRDVDRIELAFAELERGTADAVVFDEPVLRFEASSRPKLALVGGIVDPDKYGIAVATGSPLRESINGVLLAMNTDGTLESLKNRWFGN